MQLTNLFCLASVLTSVSAITGNNQPLFQYNPNPANT